MSDLKSTVQADVAKVEASAKAEVAKVEGTSFSFKTVAIVAAVAFVAGLLVHLL